MKRLFDKKSDVNEVKMVDVPSNEIDIKVKLLNSAAHPPSYANPGDSGFDLSAMETVLLYPNHVKVISTGLAFEVPEGYELQVRPRSGLSAKTGLRITNSPGTVDSSYRGEVKVIVQNVFPSTLEIKAGDKIAQAVLVPVYKANFEVVEELSQTERQDKGFGSSDARQT